MSSCTKANGRENQQEKEGFHIVNVADWVARDNLILNGACLVWYKQAKGCWPTSMVWDHLTLWTLDWIRTLSGLCSWIDEFVCVAKIEITIKNFLSVQFYITFLVHKGAGYSVHGWYCSTWHNFLVFENFLGNCALYYTPLHAPFKYLKYDICWHFSDDTNRKLNFHLQWFDPPCLWSLS